MNDSRQSPFVPPESELQHLNEQLKDRYRLEAMIGTGAVGAVYRAMDLNLNRKVAIKAIREPYQLSSKWHDRFHEEAKIIEVRTLGDCAGPRDRRGRSPAAHRNGVR